MWCVPVSMQQAKNFSISVYFCENLPGCFALGLAKKVMCPCVGGAKQWWAQYGPCSLFILSIFSLGAKYRFFFFRRLLSVLEVLTRSFHSKLQGSPEPNCKKNYVKYSGLLVQKLNAVLQCSWSHARIKNINSEASFLHTFHLRSSSCCKAEVFLDCCIARAWLEKLPVKHFSVVMLN